MRDRAVTTSRLSVQPSGYYHSEQLLRGVWRGNEGQRPGSSGGGFGNSLSDRVAWRNLEQLRVGFDALDVDHGAHRFSAGLGVEAFGADHHRELLGTPSFGRHAVNGRNFRIAGVGWNQGIPLAAHFQPFLVLKSQVFHGEVVGVRPGEKPGAVWLRRHAAERGVQTARGRRWEW